MTPKTASVSLPYYDRRGARSNLPLHMDSKIYETSRPRIWNDRSVLMSTANHSLHEHGYVEQWDGRIAWVDVQKEM